MIYNKYNTCQAHCTLCDVCFASESAFDLHLGGPEVEFDHYYPEDLAKVYKRQKGGGYELRPGLRLRTHKGQCKSYNDARYVETVVVPRRPVTIWEDAERVDESRTRFATLEERKRIAAKGDSSEGEGKALSAASEGREQRYRSRYTRVSSGTRKVRRRKRPEPGSAQQKP